MAIKIEIDKSIRSPNFHSDPGRDVKFVVIHQTMGSFESDVTTLTNDQVPLDKRVSTHYLIDRKGKIFELVSPSRVAWHAGAKKVNQKNGHFREIWGFGNENTHSVGIELTAFEDQALTQQQRAAVAKLVAFLITQFPAIRRDRSHIIGHYEISSVKIDPQRSVPDNPKNWDWDKFMEAVQINLGDSTLPGLIMPAEDLEPLPEGATDDGFSLTFPQTGQSVGGGFRNFWRKRGNGLFVCGFPLTGEISEGGLTVQYFENVRMEWQPGTQPRFGPVARDYLQLAGIPQNHQPATGEFKALAERFDQSVCGSPITGEIQEGDLTVQYFENVRMEKRAGTPVRFGAVGRMYLEELKSG